MLLFQQRVVISCQGIDLTEESSTNRVKRKHLFTNNIKFGGSCFIHLNKRSTKKE